MKFRTSDGVQLSYTDTGDMTKHPILCLPGIGASHHLWDILVKLLTPDFRVLVLDPRNQGRSQRTYKGQRMSIHARDVSEFCQQLALTGVIGIGNSMGAATLWAYQNLYGSGAFRAMVDLDQSPKMIRDDTWSYGFTDLTWDTFPELLEFESARAVVAPLSAEMVAAAKAEYASYPYSASDNYRLLVDHAFQDWRDVIMDTKIPLLVVAGEQSSYFDYHFASAVASLNPKVSAQVISNCGHVVQAEQPQILWQTLVKFLQHCGF